MGSAGRRVLVTGMSGAGKSTVLDLLAARGYRTVETDAPEWLRRTADGTDEVWREDRMAALLAGDAGPGLFVAGCRANQGLFRDRFDHVVLLHAPTPVLLQRLRTRTGGFGRTDAERDKVLADIAEVVPLLLASCDVHIDTADTPPAAVADRLVALVSG
ncbi:AAA family ATPase [Nakamurella endophytica]|uniref:Shikimate kinase n=1 Tax=Nakamurella endophytica TaxID=1748367 RepID=A0A917SK14_9ACTN|nr:AAA family ATPase [Nakamurella endophytica]GGL85155.1 hypothetical protein GCM10011594_00980 [Nakamurella endophytica]